MTPTINAKQQALVAVYLMGARAKTHEEMVFSVKLAKGLEEGMSAMEVEQAKLEAELELDQPKRYHVHDGRI